MRSCSASKSNPFSLAMAHRRRVPIRLSNHDTTQVFLRLSLGLRVQADPTLTDSSRAEGSAPPRDSQTCLCNRQHAGRQNIVVFHERRFQYPFHKTTALLADTGVQNHALPLRYPRLLEIQFPFAEHAAYRPNC